MNLYSAIRMEIGKKSADHITFFLLLKYSLLSLLSSKKNRARDSPNKCISCVKQTAEIFQRCEVRLSFSIKESKVRF